MVAQGLPIYVLRRARKLYGLLAKFVVKLAAATFARHITWLYQKDLPGDRGRLFKIFALLEGYTGISSIDVERHLKYIVSHHAPFNTAFSHYHPPTAR